MLLQPLNTSLGFDLLEGAAVIGLQPQEIVDTLHLQGAIVKLDAMGCQKDDTLPEPCITNGRF